PAPGGGSRIAWWIVVREERVWCVLSWAAPLMLVAVGFAWLLGLLRGRDGVVGGLFPWYSPGGLLGARAGLVLGLVFAWLAVLLPHLPTVNPGGLPVSVDTFYYTLFLERADGLGLSSALREVSMARPVYMVMLYGLHRLVGDPFLLMDVVHPLLAYSLLVVSVYRAAGRLLGEGYAGFAALLAGLGHAVTAFTLNGLQANSLALVFAIQLLVVESTAALALLMLLVALIHPWTHVMYSAGLILYRWRSRSLRAALKTAGLAAATLALAELAARALAGEGVVAATAKPLAPGRPLLGLLRGLHAMGWGSALNAPIYVMAALSPSPPAAAYLLAASSPLLLLGSITITHRLLVNTPLELLAARLLASLPKQLRLALLLAAASRYLVLLAAAQPLTGSLWWSIIASHRPR
ncbi:MAG: hypothetical protein DSY37_03860, partial [Hyperthermus sp.]